MAYISSLGYNDLMQHLILAETKKLQYVSLPLMTNKKCGEFWTPGKQLTENMICTGSAKSVCQEDSGKTTVEPCKWQPQKCSCC